MPNAAQRLDPVTPLPPQDLHEILQEWSQLITALANLIRENVEGLLPAVFGLANLANRANEAQIDAAGQAREAEASLRDRAFALRAALAPLAHEVAARKADANRQSGLAERARALRAEAPDGSELADFLDTLIAHDDAVLPAARRLCETADRAVFGVQHALDALDADLSHTHQRLHNDSERLQAAAARVRQFVESSKQAIDQLILKLQFQDRTDQILSHLKTDFESLSRMLSTLGEQQFDARAWREERTRRFTTIEERSGGQALSTESGDIELF